MTQQIICKNCCCNLSYWNFTGSYKNHFPSEKAGAIIVHDDKILIVKSRGNKWGFPKGSVEPYETKIECAQREVREETGMSLSLSNCSKKNLGDVTLFIKYLEEPDDLDIKKILKGGENDCSGIGWIKQGCLINLIKNKQVDVNFSLRKFILTFD